ncbi:hypothetical protein PUR71_29115 [Streptomyces sp. SP17BM10]|uniref:hypothetical protein n=1 Tax=Streptomyces sp. SP17BM10 TaxID=3002530 RepID=UPI002E791525|nr:hypothetical protein [Streptomyces sp. SP17BM10]MEE1786934.1 hypothetical protein [Streptomyces sp. SP17BM10]
MTDHPHRRTVPLAACGCVAALGAAAAVVAAISDAYAVCAIGLLLMGGAALAGYGVARAADARTDQLVLQRLHQEPGIGTDVLAADLALRPAAVRLSLHRLSRNGSLPAPDGPADTEH